MKFTGKVTQWDCMKGTFKIGTQVGSVIITTNNQLVKDTLVEAMRKRVDVTIEAEVGKSE